MLLAPNRPVRVSYKDSWLNPVLQQMMVLSLLMQPRPPPRVPLLQQRGHPNHLCPLTAQQQHLPTLQWIPPMRNNNRLGTNHCHCHRRVLLQWLWLLQWLPPQLNNSCSRARC
jgi:hypothetical protein